MLLVLILVITIIVLLLFKFSFCSFKESYWSQYGIREIDASPAASLLEIIMGKKDPTDRDKYVYNLMGDNEKFVGMSEMGYNVIFLKDLDLIKKVMVKDFNHFVDRRSFVSGLHENHLLRKILPFLQGEQWKTIRSLISPTFTTGKIRRYMYFFNSIGKDLVEMLKKKAENSEPKMNSLTVEVLNTVNRFAIDCIASSVFGLEAGTVQNPNSTFATMSYKFSKIRQKRLAFGIFFPRLSQFLGLEPLDTEASAYFERLVSEGLKERMRDDAVTTPKRNDFLQMMAELKKGEMTEDGQDDLNNFEKEGLINDVVDKKLTMTEDVINAQTFFFFFAGFINARDIISWVLYALAVHSDIQDLVREEVKSVVSYDGTLEYHNVGKLIYMDMFFSEVLRLYSPALRNERVCTKDYKDPETGLFIPKGTLVIIPSDSFHHDSKYFQNPDKFDIQNFNTVNNDKRHPYAYMPFGHGPRNCLGMRLVLVECKAVIAQIIYNFKIEPSKKTPIPMKKGIITGLQRLPPQDLELNFQIL